MQNPILVNILDMVSYEQSLSRYYVKLEFFIISLPVMYVCVV